MYPHLRDESRWVVPEVLAHQAAARGDAPFVTMVDGPALTYAQAQDEAARMAGFLAGHGVQPGDMVAVMLPNGLDFVRVWLGLARLGAVLVALNTDLKGAFLEHQLENAAARLAIVDQGLLDRFADVAPRLTALKTVLTVGTAVAPSGFPFTLAALEGWRAAEPCAGPMPRAGDTHCVMYTSGTTGPSKGVLMPHGHAFLFALGSIDNYAMTEADRYYICLPLFHANGLFMQLFASMVAGCGAVLRERFSASAWISDIRRYGCTLTNSLGAVTAFVVSQPPRADDRDHRLRLVSAAPNPAATEAVLRERFGIRDVVGIYGMTEVNIPLYCEMGNPRPGTCGRLYDRYFEVEIRDPVTDIPVPRGSVGELMVRPKAASGFMSGYHRMPDKTVEAWRNLWFHTGDAAVMGEDGYVTFVDRIKDCIRRRGENVSSYEVETAVARLEGVEEVAAYGVPTGIAGMEDDIMLAIVPSEGASLDPKAIVDHAARELPRYAQPRYVEIVDALPKTPTAKIQKAKLRERGVGPGAWDREREGA